MLWYSAVAAVLLAVAVADKEWFPGDEPRSYHEDTDDRLMDLKLQVMANVLMQEKENLLDIQRQRELARRGYDLQRQRDMAPGGDVFQMNRGKAQRGEGFQRDREVARREDDFQRGEEKPRLQMEPELLQQKELEEGDGDNEFQAKQLHQDDDFVFAVGPNDPRFDGIDVEEEGEGSTRVRYIGEHLTPLTFIAIVAACSLGGVVIVAVVSILTYRLQQKAKAAAEVEYPAYGVTGPSKDVSPTTADRRLAQSAHMYHYQHQKQQIIAMERSSEERRGSVSEAESDEDNEEGDYTVYECPGLASTGEMEVKNPLFLDDPTPAP